LRLKGFLALAGSPSRLVVQAVGPRIETYFDRPWTDGEPRDGALVVIGLTGLDRRAIAAALAG
jgi:cobalamin biosynthesis protein CobW